MKTIIQVFFFQFILYFSFAQHTSVSADRNNVFYIGVDNPITVTAENTSCKDLILKTDNGTITGTGCEFTYRAVKTGSASISVSKNISGKVKALGNWYFRVKRIPPPTFRIGPYGNTYSIDSERKVVKVVIANQQYVRAELEGFDINATFTIDSFYVTIFSVDSCKSKNFFNTSGKISEEISKAFADLKKDDVLIFNRIFAKGPDQIEWQLNPLILTIDN